MYYILVCRCLVLNQIMLLVPDEIPVYKFSLADNLIFVLGQYKLIIAYAWREAGLFGHVTAKQTTILKTQWHVMCITCMI